MIGIAGPANHEWLAAHGVKPVAYGEGLADRLREAAIDAFIDTHGGGYVTLAIELGVPRDRINTIIDFAAAQECGVKAEGSQSARNAAVLAELAGLIASGKLEVPIAATFPLDDVRAAFRAARAGPHAGKDRPAALIVCVWSPSLSAAPPFRHAMSSAVRSPRTSIAERLNRLTVWASAPSARATHPREEHLLP